MSRTLSSTAESHRVTRRAPKTNPRIAFSIRTALRANTCTSSVRTLAPGLGSWSCVLSASRSSSGFTPDASPSSLAHNIPVAQVARQASGLSIVALDSSQAIFVCSKCTRLQAVQSRRIFTEDRTLDRPGRGPERREAELALHVLGNLEAPQPFDLPLRCARPDRIRPPHHALRPQPFQQRPHDRGA